MVKMSKCYCASLTRSTNSLKTDFVVAIIRQEVIYKQTKGVRKIGWFQGTAEVRFAAVHDSHFFNMSDGPIEIYLLEETQLKDRVKKRNRHFLS